MAASENRGGFGGDGRKPGRRGKTPTRRRLADSVEQLERRLLLSANSLDVVKVRWGGQLVEAVRNEYVFRMPQTNARTATSVLDYQHRTPAVPRGWSTQTLGSGFLKLTAPNATTNTLVSWGRANGVQSLNVNAVSRMAQTPNDPLYADAANWAFPQISAPDAWDTGTGTGTTIVAVLDSGIDYNHPDLVANMWRNPNEIAGDGIDNDNNGYVDDVHGINAITGSGNPMDDNGHGTFCAGLIGAVGNNNVGLAGVNWSVGLMAVKIMSDDGIGTLAAELRGIQYVLSQKIAGQNIAAANLSYGRYQYVQAEFDALNQLAQTGVVLVCAAGNDFNDNDLVGSFPDGYEIPGLISVAASDRNDGLAVFPVGASNYGRTKVDLFAPGRDVLSTRAALASPLAYPPHRGDDNYSVSSGTSFSAPLVAGTAALLKSLKRAASAEQIKTAILNGADRVADLAGFVVTGGRLNVSNAVDLILSTQGATPVASFTAGQNLSFLEGSTGYSHADIKVSLDRPADPGKSVSVWYETRPGGSAIQNVDFVAQAGFLTFSGSEVEKSFRIRIVGDRLPEGNERFAVRLEASRSRGVEIGDSQANVIIIDDDNISDPVQPGPTNPGGLPLLSVDLKREVDPADPTGMRPVPVYEGGMATFVVSLDKTSNKTIAVKYRTNHPTLVPNGTALPGLDYTAVSGTLTFRPGERTKEFTVRILTDKISESDESFRVVLQEPMNAEVAAGGGGGVTATITNVAPVVPPAPGFQITVNYLGSIPAQLRAATDWAMAKWSRVITGDLPNVTDPQTGSVIDDILVDVQVGLLGGTPSDGTGGALANARPTQFRTDSLGLPWQAEIGIDAADAADPQLRDIVLHELGHALGFGETLFSSKRLYNAAGDGFIGANALREYRTIFGVRAALAVPIEIGGGPGTAGSHWSEAVMGAELMTGDADMGVSLPLSRITVGAMQDLGYRVNYNAADVYAKTALRAAVGSTTVTRGTVRSTSPVAPGRSLLVRAESGSAVTRATVSVGNAATALERSGARAFAALVTDAAGSGPSLRWGGIPAALASRPMFAALARR